MVLLAVGGLCGGLHAASAGIVIEGARLCSLLKNLALDGQVILVQLIEAAPARLIGRYRIVFQAAHAY
jgi:hypothetical protein